MERQFSSFIASCLSKLLIQRFFVYPDSHGRNFQCTLKRFMPEQQIPVQFPVIIVRCPAVMLLSGSQQVSDLHDKSSLMLFYIKVFSLLWRNFRIHIFQFLRGNKRNFPAKLCIQIFILIFYLIQGITDSSHNTVHCIFQIFQIPVFSCYDLFPVPLVYIYRMEIIQFFISSDRIHICEKSFSHMKIIAVQGHPFPLCQRMDYLSLGACIRNIKSDRSLYSVQIII